MAFPTTSVLDTFTTGADSTPPSGWARFAGQANDFTALTATNNARGPSGVVGFDYWSAAQFGPDCEVGITIPTIPTSGQRIFMYYGITNTPPTVAAALNGYRLLYTAVAGAANDTWVLSSIVAGAISTIGTGTTVDLVAGDSIGIERIANVHTVYRKTGGTWGAMANLTSISNSDVTGAGYLALGIEDTTIRVDDFFGGTVVTAGGGPAWDKVVFANIATEYPITEYGTRWYSGYGSPPADWTATPTTSYDQTPGFIVTHF